MSYAVTRESFASIASYWGSSDNSLNWGSVFVLPAWLEVWWREFQPQSELYLCVVRQQADIIGIAPLQVKKTEASFIGSVDVCDYLDFVVAPGRERDFCGVLLDYLSQEGINRLDMGHVRPDSIVLTGLVNVASSRGYDVARQPEAVSLDMDLPASWDDYLVALTKKQRHELKRKLRRFWEVGNASYQYLHVAGDTGKYLDIFLRLFAMSRGEKADFMSARMESFFRSLAEAMAEIGLLRFGILEVDALMVAMTMGFDYNGKVYLYNSAYDPEYSYLSVGVLSKALGIKESIQSGMKVWDFLKGAEVYKHHLGGREVPLYSCQIAIK